MNILPSPRYLNFSNTISFQAISYFARRSAFLASRALIREVCYSTSISSNLAATLYSEQSNISKVGKKQNYYPEHCSSTYLSIMEPFGFEKLPEIIRQLFEKVEHIEEMVSALQPINEGTNDLLTVREAADYLKISVQSLYCKVSRMEIPVSKPGRRLYFSQSELKKWISASRRKTAAELIRDSQEKYSTTAKNSMFI